MMNKKLALIFPGQGSQSVGMLKDIAPNFPVMMDYFKRANDILGYDLWRLTQEGPQTQLDQTEFTQPALFVASFALWKMLEETFGLAPAIVAGHSLGEYSALACAETLPFEDALRLVQLRARLMQEACPVGVGAMAAIIGLDDNIVMALCESISTDHARVVPANFNAPAQTVVAGHVPAVEALVNAAKEKGALLAKILPVSVPAHSFLMKPAAKELEEILAHIHFLPPKFPVLHNVNAGFCSDPQQIGPLLKAQLFSPVLWTKTQLEIAQEGITLIMEVGPGKVLSGLAKRTIPEVSCLPMRNPINIEALESIT